MDDVLAGATGCLLSLSKWSAPTVGSYSEVDFSACCHRYGHRGAKKVPLCLGRVAMVSRDACPGYWPRPGRRTKSRRSLYLPAAHWPLSGRRLGRRGFNTILAQWESTYRNRSSRNNRGLNLVCCSSNILLEK